MQLLPILLVLPLLLVDGLVMPGVGGGPTAAAPVLAVGLPAVLVLAAWGGVRVMLRQLSRTRRAMWMLRADRLLGLTRLLLLVGGAVVILFEGWLAWVREHVGDLILVDELLTLAPTVAGLAGTWAIQHALEVRLRDAIRVRRLDEGRPIWPTPGRGAYVVGQIRLQLGLMGVPILAILGLAEAVREAFALAGDGLPAWAADGASLVTAAMVFVAAPLAMRLVLPIAPMPSGTVRDDLVSMCRALGVRVGDVMLWRTHGTLVNAAVVGVLPRIRYVLLTDAMVEQVSRPALRAVIAHELAHVRHRHVPWLVVTVAGLISLAGAVAAAPAVALIERGHAPDGPLVGWTAVSLGLVGLVGAGVVFGWVSRRYERQADTYAVQAMSREPAWTRPGASGEPAGPAGASAPAVPGMRPPAVLTVGDLRMNDDDDGDRGGGWPGEPPHGSAGPSAEERSSSSPDDEAAGGDLVRPEAVLAMTSALGATARLNGVDPERRSWRHGSIGWRQRYLASLVGHPIDGLSIDRVMRRLKLAAGLALVAGVGATAAVDAWEDAVYDGWRGPGWTAPEVDGGVGGSGGSGGAARPKAPVAPLGEFPLAPRRPVDGADRQRSGT